MAGKHGNGHGNGKDPLLTALQDVAAKVGEVVVELRGTNGRLERVEGVLLETRQEARETNARLGRVEVRLESVDARLGRVEVRLESVEGGLADLCVEVHEGFSELGQKIDSAADRDRHLEQSVQQLGERLARLEGRGPDPR